MSLVSEEKNEKSLLVIQDVEKPRDSGAVNRKLKKLPQSLAAMLVLCHHKVRNNTKEKRNTVGKLAHRKWSIFLTF